MHEAAMLLTPEELAAVTEHKKSSPYADLGTCIHFATQDGIRAKFADGKPKDHAPNSEQWVNATTLFDGSLERTQAAVRSASVLAAKHLNIPGIKWIAEREVITPYISGHIDFLSDSGNMLIDLKTTSKPPVGKHVKPAHLAQVCAYAQALEDVDGKAPSLAGILYVDACNAAWSTFVSINLMDETLIAYRRQLRDTCQFLMGPLLYAVAMPNIGPACEEWCPYTHICRDKVQAAQTAGPLITPKPVQVKALF
jgi:hypothetical protein